MSVGACRLATYRRANRTTAATSLPTSSPHRTNARPRQPRARARAAAAVKRPTGEATTRPEPTSHGKPPAPAEGKHPYKARAHPLQSAVSLPLHARAHHAIDRDSRAHLLARRPALPFLCCSSLAAPPAAARSMAPLLPALAAALVGAFVVFFLRAPAVATEVAAPPGLEFHVGGPRGWSVPIANNSYSWWAMNNRFRVGDRLCEYIPSSPSVTFSNHIHMITSPSNTTQLPIDATANHGVRRSSSPWAMCIQNNK